MKFVYGLVTPIYCALRRVLMVLNLSESLAKSLVIAKLNVVHLSSSKNQRKLLSLWWFQTHQNHLPSRLSFLNWTRHICLVWEISKTAVVMMVLNSSESLAKPLVMGKLNLAYLSRLKHQRNCSRWDDFKLIRITCQAACHGKTEHVIFVKFEKSAKLLSLSWLSTYQNHLPNRLSWQKWTWHICQVLKNQHIGCRPTCRCNHLGYSVPPAPHRSICCRSTIGPRGPGLSNPTSFLRSALPMATKRDHNARDKRSVLRENPATFLRDFALYITRKYAVK